MGYYYVLQGNAQLTATNNEDLLVGIFPPATVALRIKKVRFSTLGNQTTSDARLCKIMFKSFTGASTGGTAFTPLKTDANMPAPISTAKVKLTTGAHTIGTVTLIFQEIINSFADSLEWNAMDRDDEIVCKVGENFGVTCKSFGGPSITTVVLFTEQGAAG